jgi:hypothetical protein
MDRSKECSFNERLMPINANVAGRVGEGGGWPPTDQDFAELGSMRAGVRQVPRKLSRGETFQAKESRRRTTLATPSGTSVNVQEKILLRNTSFAPFLMAAFSATSSSAYKQDRERCRRTAERKHCARNLALRCGWKSRREAESDAILVSRVTFISACL